MNAGEEAEAAVVAVVHQDAQAVMVYVVVGVSWLASLGPLVAVVVVALA